MSKNRRQAKKKASTDGKSWDKPTKQPFRWRKEAKIQEPSTSKKDIQDSDVMEEYAVIATIHLNSCVPEEVQQFIKSISRQPKSESISEPNLLGVRKNKVKKMPKSASTVTRQSSRRASVQVIITTD